MDAKSFISSLSDTEISFLRKHKYDSHLRRTRDLIDAEISARQLSENDQELLIAGLPQSQKEQGCPRCGSGKLIETEIEKVKSGGSFSGIGLIHAAVYPEIKASKGIRIECAVCGMLVKDDNIEEDGLIKRFFKRIMVALGLFLRG